jgi:hypothetical protein
MGIAVLSQPQQKLHETQTQQKKLGVMECSYRQSYSGEA